MADVNASVPAAATLTAPPVTASPPAPPAAAAGTEAPQLADAYAASPGIRRGSARKPEESRPIDWGRVGIAAAMIPPAYATGILMHEAAGHGGMALALGASDVTVNPLPKTYTRSDGSTGVTFASMTYQPGEDWTPTKEALVSLGPSILDTTLMAGTTTLYETGNWPKNPWASGALLALHAAAVVDIGNAAQGALIRPDNRALDTVKAAHKLDMHPRTLGAIEGVIAVAGAVELGRIAYDVLRKPAAKAPSQGVTVTPTVSGGRGGASVGITGTF